MDDVTEPPAAAEIPLVASGQAPSASPAGDSPDSTAAATGETTPEAKRETRAEAKAKAKAEKKKHGSFVRELPILLAIAIGLALLIKAFFVQAFFIPSESMEETLLVKDRVLVNKLVYRFRDVHRGEIVVFNGLDSWEPESTIPPPKNKLDSARRKISSLLGLGQPGEKDFIKRVIGVPGDVVQCCDPQGRVMVNGQPLDESYLFEDDKQAFGPVTVPEGRLWVMGDHRGRSSDSRGHIGDENKGTIPIDRVIGRAFVIIWPLKHFQGLRVPKELEATESAMPASSPLDLLVTPPVLGLAGALPISGLRLGLRRRRARRAAA